MKISKTGIASRDAVLKGVRYVSDAVKQTIGPFGSNALIEKGLKSTNDGYLIGTELIPTIKDEFERLGARIAGEASAKTNEQSGDFTSGTWALTESIAKEALRFLPTEKSILAKKTHAEVSKMIEDGRKEIIERLKESVTPIESEESLIKSAMVSVEDEDLAQLLGSTQWKLGPKGVIIAEEVNDTISSIEIVSGIRLDNGFSNSTIINNPEKESFELSDTPILLTNYTIGVEEIAGLKESVITPLIHQKKQSLIIMARAFTPDAIKLCMETMKAGFGLYPINAPYTDQAEMMRDLEAVVGGRYIDSEEGSLSDIYISDIGYAKRIVARRFDAIVTGVEDDNSKERIEKRVEQLKSKLKGSQSDFEKKSLETRIAQFISGFAILKVGSPSLSDRKRIKDKADDAVNAVRLALKGGTVRGGGLAFKEISDQLSEDNILKRPITVIYDQIMGSAPEGFEIAEWVRDPYLVLENGLTNACSTASILIRTNCAVTEENPRRKKEEDDD